MAYVAFDTTYMSQSDTLYRVKIHDYTGSGTTRTMSISELYIETRGDDRDVLDDIKPARAGLKFYANETYTQAFRDLLISEGEGRFYIEILESTNRLFFGRIIGNSYSQEDRVDPEVSIEAIDGLTLLKTKQYLHPSVTGFSNLKDLFLYFIKRLDVVNRFYSSGDELLFFSSSLENNIGKIYETTYHADYFFTENNGKRKYLTDWEALTELLRRYFLRMHYQDGRYYVIGKETWTATRPNFNVYFKNGALSRTVPIGNSINLLHDDYSRMLAGGTFFYEPGHKRATIKVSQYHLNKNLADGLYWYRSTTAYVDVNTLIADTVYKLRANVNVNVDKSLYDPTIQYFRLKFHIKRVGETNTTYEYITTEIPPLNVNIEMGVAVYNVTTTATTTVEFVDVLFPFFSPQDFYIDFEMDDAIEDKQLEIKVEFIAFYDGAKSVVSTIPGLENCYTCTFDVGIALQETKQDVIFAANVTGSEESEEKSIDILACDQYGSSLARPYIKPTTGGNFAITQNQWRFGTSGAYTPLERLIVKRMLGIIADKQRFYQGGYYRRDNFPKLVDTIQYRNDSYMIGTQNWDLLNEIGKITLIYTGSYNTNVDVEPDEPILIPEYPDTDILDPQSPPGGIESYYEDFENVTTDNVVVSTNLEFYFNTGDFLGIKRKWKVYLNGLKCKYIDFESLSFPLTPGDLDTNQWSVDVANNTIYFGYQLDGEYVEVEFLKI